MCEMYCKRIALCSTLCIMSLIESAHTEENTMKLTRKANGNIEITALNAADFAAAQTVAELVAAEINIAYGRDTSDDEDPYVRGQNIVTVEVYADDSALTVSVQGAFFVKAAELVASYNKQKAVVAEEAADAAATEKANSEAHTEALDAAERWLEIAAEAEQDGYPASAAKLRKKAARLIDEANEVFTPAQVIEAEGLTLLCGTEAEKLTQRADDCFAAAASGRYDRWTVEHLTQRGEHYRSQAAALAANAPAAATRQ